MNTLEKRAFSALATVAVVAVTVFGIVGLTAVPVAAEDTITLSGPTSGHVGEPLTYTALVTRSTLLNPDRIPASGYGVTFGIGSPMGLVNKHIATTNAEGIASTSYIFTQPGAHQLQARGTDNPYVSSTLLHVTITEATPTPTITTPTPTDSGRQPTGGASYTPSPDVVSTPMPSTSGVIEDIAAQAEAATGLGSNALYILLALIIVVLLAIVAAALLMRRR